MHNSVAFEDIVDAPIIIPGIRTSFEMCDASRSRMEMRLDVEWRMTWNCGKWTSGLPPRRIIYRPHSRTAASNWYRIRTGTVIYVGYAAYERKYFSGLVGKLVCELFVE